jgi:hypothetical protein
MEAASWSSVGRSIALSTSSRSRLMFMEMNLPFPLKWLGT